MFKSLLVFCVCGVLLVGCKQANQDSQSKKQSKNHKDLHATQKTVAKVTKKDTRKPKMVLEGKTLAAGAKVSAATDCKIHLKVSGMMCPDGCAPQVRTALKGVKGVKEALVSFKTKSATVEGKGSVCGGKTTQELIDKAFAKKTYKCNVNKIELFN